MEKMLTRRPWQNLYIHVPFCGGKCDYCAFYSEGDGANFMRPWLDRIRRGLEEAREYAPDTVYVGGGTPTLLPPAMLEELFLALESALPPTEEREVSIECNPESLTAAKAEILGKHVTRVSLGVQSFAPELRQKIGRRGEPEKILPAFELLAKNGVTNLSCDLIYGLPGQDCAAWERELDQALAFPLAHLSAYALSVEAGTKLSRRYRPEPDADRRTAEMDRITRRRLRQAGMRRYEISNYAKPGCECRHNQNVWHGETCLGLGPGACSFDGRDRFTRVAPVEKWLSGAPPKFDRVPVRTRRAEMFIMGLRTVRGWAKGEFAAAAGANPENLWPETLADLRREKLLKKQQTALTMRGLDFWNDIALRFL